MADTTVAEKKTDAPLQRLTKKPKRNRLRIIAPIVLVVLAVAGYFLWNYFGSYESTDDAQIDGHLNAISARISGQVIEVLVDDEQIVKKGDVLVKIDPRDYEVAVAKAEADLADAKASLKSSRTEVPITSTNTDSTLRSARSARVDTSAGLTARNGSSMPPRRVWRPRRRRCTKPRRTTKRRQTTWSVTSSSSPKTKFRSKYTTRRSKRLPPRRRPWLRGQPP
jgi:multidrug resistance efflux pump